MHGLPVSFSLRRDAAMQSRYGLAPYAYTDLTVPELCPGPGQTGFAGAQWGSAGAIRPSGVFDDHRYPVQFTGPRAATLVLHPRGAHCPGSRLVWHLGPAHRRTVLDGRWRLSYSDGESFPLFVDAGGRIADGLMEPASGLAACGYLGAGGGAYFIAADGSSSDTDAEDELSLRLSFTRSTASGAVTFSGPSCAATTLAVSATLVARGAAPTPLGGADRELTRRDGD